MGSEMCIRDRTVSDRRGGVTDAVAIAPELCSSRGNFVLRSRLDLGRSMDLVDLFVLVLSANSCEDITITCSD